MTRSELISALIQQQPHLSKRDVELAVNCILKQLVDALDAGKRIEIRGGKRLLIFATNQC